MSRAHTTHCKRGHELSQENCYASLWPRLRKCRLCVAIKGAARREREKAWRHAHPKRRSGGPRRWKDEERTESPDPRTSDELLLACEATASERMRVFRCVAAIRRFQGDLERDLHLKASGQYEAKKRAGNAQLSECEVILDGIHWRRQARLMSAAIALAKEQGVCFQHTLDGALAQRIFAEGA